MQRTEVHKRALDGVPRIDRPVLITGGAGFIGANLAHRLLSEGHEVWLYDDLSRPGVEANVRSLIETFGSRLRLIVADIRDGARVREAVAAASAVYHFAAQVAVTTSLQDPELDFSVNVQGTLNVLEALRRTSHPPPLLYTSTNKVYGSLADVPLREDAQRVVPRDPELHERGVDEGRNLDFHSPYGCSKGAADQYVLDYARSFDLRAVVFRMSCIYGPRQCGNEDQGWVAHFLMQALSGEPITLYGDGKQVRDILYVDDLLDAMGGALSNIDALSGQAFNVGGGPENTVSLREVVRAIGELTGAEPVLRFAEPRLGDQRYYVSDTSKLTRVLGWRAKTPWREGVSALHRWLSEHPARAARRPSRSEGDAWVAP
jgi:CDP-paratose 2-epimerase